MGIRPRTWVGRFNTVESEYILIDNYIAFGELAQAAEILEAMPVKFQALNLDAHLNYLDYFAVVQKITELEVNVDENVEIPAHLIEELIRLSNNNDFVAIKARSLGEIIVANWADYYSYTFEIHPSCVCTEKSGSGSPSLKSMSNGNDESSVKEGIINEKPEITLTPNPTTRELKIESGELKIESIRIFNVLGQEIFNFQFSTFNSIDISHLANGMYFIRIQTANGTTTKKIVKK